VREVTKDKRGNLRRLVFGFRLAGHLFGKFVFPFIYSSERSTGAGERPGEEEKRESERACGSHERKRVIDAKEREHCAD
jgi:hypothetical protein